MQIFAFLRIVFTYSGLYVRISLEHLRFLALLHLGKTQGLAEQPAEARSGSGLGHKYMQRSEYAVFLHNQTMA